MAANGPETDAGEDITGQGPGATFDNVYRLLKARYVDPLPSDAKFAHGAAAAMVASLQDPDSRFMEAPEVAELGEEAKGTYRGSGAAFAVKRVHTPRPPTCPPTSRTGWSSSPPYPAAPPRRAA